MEGEPYQSPIIIETTDDHVETGQDKPLPLSVRYDGGPGRGYKASAEELRKAGAKSFEENAEAINEAFKRLERGE